MSLANEFLKDNRFELAEFPRTGMFSSFSLDDFADAHFSNFSKFEMTPNHTFYAGGPNKTPQETEEFVSLYFDGFIIEDENDNGFVDPGEKVFSSFKIFISDDGAFLLERYNEVQKTIRADEIAVFLEYNKGDIFSDAVMLVSVGYKAKDDVSVLLTKFGKATGGRYTLNKKQRDLLISSFTRETDWFSILRDVAIESATYTLDYVASLGVEIFGEIADFFGETLRVKDSFWNPRIEGYTVGVINDGMFNVFDNASKKIDRIISTYESILPFILKKILKSFSLFTKGIAVTLNEIRTTQEFAVAFVCGIWNGLMDMISGIFGLIELIFKAIRSGNKVAYSGYVFATKGDFYEALMLEYLDNLFKEFFKIDWKKVIIQMNQSRLELEKYLYDIPSKLFNKITDLNHAEVGYYVGYVVFQIIEFLFPLLKIAKLGKLGKLSKVANIFGDLGSVGTRASRVGSKVRSVADDFFDLIVGLIEKLKGGTASFIEWIKEIFTNIRKWLDDLLGIGKKVNVQNIDGYIAKYPTLIRRGSSSARSKFNRELGKLEKELRKKTFKTERHKGFEHSKLKGDRGEEIIEKLFKGKRPDDPKSFKTSLTRRYPDNFHEGTLREVKAGNLTLKYKKQILKDIEIFNNKFTISGKRIKKLEWHVFGDIDETVLKFIELELKKYKNLQGKFVIIKH